MKQKETLRHLSFPIAYEEQCFPISSLVTGQLFADKQEMMSMSALFNTDFSDVENPLLPYRFIFWKQKCSFTNNGKRGYVIYYENIFSQEKDCYFKFRKKILMKHS